MKKIIALFMASVLCISFCACNNSSSTNKLSIEEITNQAEELGMSDLMYELNNNMACAKELYHCPTYQTSS